VYGFLIPLLIGFAANLASASTTSLARRFGPRRGRWAGVILRDLLGIPLWATGIALAYSSPARPLYPPGPPTNVAGWLLLGSGSLVVLWALLAIGRRSYLPSTGDTLVRHGLYARIRHPIYTGVLLEFAGLVVLRPAAPTLLACGLGFVWAALQARAEELDLLRRLPAYRQYMRQVPRFIPNLRKR
jgi:protein-S-isoprenylcysteine O-methyltransferase Ste14